MDCIIEFIYLRMMLYCQKPSSIFSFIPIHRSQWSPTSLPKDRKPTCFTQEKLKIKCRQWGSILMVYM